MPLATVILTTHNNPRALEFCLHGLARQDQPDFATIIADDGSKDDTRDTIRRVRGTLGPRFRHPIVHLWQPHRGHYGKAAIVNKAIVLAQTDYLILADGDVIPRHDYVRTHLELRRPRCFLAGGDFRLSPAATQALTLGDVDSGRCFDARFLRRIGQPHTRKLIKLLPRSWFTRAFDAANISPARWSGSNASCWKDLLVRVGGFDESFTSYSKDDVELGARLNNIGVRGRHVRHNALCLHLDHSRPGHQYDPAKFAKNFALLRETKSRKLTKARIGIEKMVRDFTVEG